MTALDHITDIAGVRAMCNLLGLMFVENSIGFYVGRWIVFKRNTLRVEDERTDEQIIGEMRNAIYHSSRAL